VRGSFGSEVQKHIDREVKRQLAQTLSELKASRGRTTQRWSTMSQTITVPLNKEGRPRGNSRLRKVTRKKASPARQLQAKYMVAMRGLTVSQKNEVRAAKQSGGTRAAIRLARSFSGTP
jgi:hypothetical protein